MAEDIFHFREFSMHQAKSGQRVNTDSCVVGAVIGAKLQPHKILDIGTGTGVLAFMLALRFPSAQITAIEPEQDIAEVAQKNFSKPQWGNRIALHRLRAQDLDPAKLGTFDFVLCNPPYFQNSTFNSDRLRTIARHNSDLSPKELYESMSRMMTSDGTAWLSFPEDSSKLWMDAAADANLFPMYQLIVKDHPDARPHMSIVGWSKSIQTEITKGMIHYRDAHKGPLSAWMKVFRDQWYPAHYNTQFL